MDEHVEVPAAFVAVAQKLVVESSATETAMPVEPKSAAVPVATDVVQLEFE